MRRASVERVRSLVIGGGVVGSAVAWELARRGYEPLLVERGRDVGEGASKANSAIVHTGFDAFPGTVEAEFLARARSLWPGLVEELGLPFHRVGALMVAATDPDLRRLRGEVRERAAVLGVPVEIVGGAELRDLAPYLRETIAGAMLVADESVVDPFWLTRAFAESAVAAGARVLLGRPVVGLEPGRDAVRVILSDGCSFVADQVVNCAGLHADEVAELAGDGDLLITPRKGEFLVSEESFAVDHIVLPIPGPMGKGMLVTPIVFGGLLLGPTAVDQVDKLDHSTDGAAGEAILRACTDLVPALGAAIPVRQFAGLRTVSGTGDYVVRPSRVSDRIYHVAGIRSTGISTSPAIGQTVAEDIERLRGWRPVRHHVQDSGLPPRHLPDDVQEVVCLCRSITRPEVQAALQGRLAPRTLDALKRRCGVTFGDCQGNLCTVDAASLLAEARGTPPSSVLRGVDGSWLFAPGAGPVEPPPVAEVGGPGVEPSDGVELVVIGAGLAGIGAALAAHRLGLRPIVIERGARAGGPLARRPELLSRTETEALASFELARADGRIRLVGRVTAVGLMRVVTGWEVICQGPERSFELTARTIVLTTGGYVEPLEHVRVTGPRPSGIVTADLVDAALRTGLLPGTRAVLIGEGRLATGVGLRLEDAGCQVVARSPVLPTRVMGAARLEMVQLGGEIVEADTLVLCHRLLPQSFLLRGLGLVDARPGQPAPARPDGSVADGIWAAGTCVRPDVDHAGSLDDGLRVGTAAAAGSFAPL